MLTKQANGEMVFHLNLMTPQSSSAVDRHYILNSTVLISTSSNSNSFQILFSYANHLLKKQVGFYFSCVYVPFAAVCSTFLNSLKILCRSRSPSQVRNFRCFVALATVQCFLSVTRLFRNRTETGVNSRVLEQNLYRFPLKDMIN